MTDTSARILVVDDEVPVREVLGKYFTAQGYAVELASNSLDALAAAERHKPDVVVLDVGLPESDAFEVLKRLRDTAPRAEVIMLLGNHDVWLAHESLNAGAFDYVKNPLDVERLAGAVSAAAGRARLHDVGQRLRSMYLVGFACLTVLGAMVFELARRHLMSVSLFAGAYFVLMSVGLALGFYAVARLISLERRVRPRQARPSQPDDLTLA